MLSILSPECFECLDRDRNYNITIRATQCNGKRECKYKNDENYCEENNLNIYIPMLPAFVVTAIICYLLDYSIKRIKRQVVHTFYVFSDHY